MKARNLGTLQRSIYNRYGEEFGCLNTTFVAPKDTNAFCRLVELAVEHGDVAVDLGCGDGIPTVHAAVCGAQTVIGIDEGAKAISNTRRNASLVTQATGRVCAVQADLHDFLSTAALRRSVFEQCGLTTSPLNLVMGNLPYIPTSKPATAGVDGGIDGLRHIRELLTHGSEIAKLAWQQGSYSSPLVALEMISQLNFVIDRMLAYATIFGNSSMEHYDHLNNLREKGQAFFWTSPDGGPRPHWYLIMGFVVRRSPGEECCDWSSVTTLVRDFLTGFTSDGPTYLSHCDLEMPFEVEVGCYPD